MKRIWIDAMVVALCGLLASGALAEKRSKRSKRPTRSPRKTTPSQVVKQGKVVVVRGVSHRQPQLTDRQGRTWLLAGKLRPELSRLHGHEVKVWGRPGKGKQMMATLQVGRYEITDVGGGRKPQIGQLDLDARRHLVLSQDSRSLKIKASSAMRRKLRRRVGCKVWIAGTLAAGTIKVSKFGWLRCKKASIKPGEGAPKRRH